MATLQTLLKQHLEARNISVKTLAERLGISYPTVLALVNKGSLPRSQEHRDGIRVELAVPLEQWAAVLAASMKDGVEIPTEGPLTLQQLVTKAMYTLGLTEQRLSEKCGLPYPTLLGITRKGSIPRGDTLVTLAEALDLELGEVQDAVALSKQRRGQDDAVPAGLEQHAEDDAEPHDAPPIADEEVSLAQLALDAITRSGVSTAAFAKQYNIPYISLTRLIRDGIVPIRSVATEPLREALGLDADAFATALDRARANPAPASRAKSSEIASNPLQASLLRLVDERGLSMKAFAELADLSVLTATRLLRKGDLPGRQATHTKLRGLLALGQTDYELLLQRARAAGARDVDEDGDEAQPSAIQPLTEPFLRQSPVLVSLGGSGSPAGGAPVPPGEYTDADFMAIISRLGGKQRRAVMGFLQSLV